MQVEYYVAGRKRRVQVPVERTRRGGPLSVLAAESAVDEPPAVTVEPGRALSVSGAPAGELRWLRSRFGLDVVAEGRHGKVLLAAPADTSDPVRLAARAAVEVYERGRVESAQPNFLRTTAAPAPASTDAVEQWGLHNSGRPGIAGADVAARAAWTITEGSPTVRLAVLDDGVDATHPALKPAVSAERDFVDGAATAAPGGTNAHGTRCAGIAVSRDPDVRGLAPAISLVACPIMKSVPGGWRFDDFTTADAIDWCWEDAAADVPSNSWAYSPSDLIVGALQRARTQGRGGRGAVVVIAAGNDEGQVRFPANLPDILTVGATNEWDERKTTTSRDGETTWGSNVGKGLDLMAPGVHIRTTDRPAPGRLAPATGRFNGTSSATPFVAAAAALVLSLAPDLTEAEVRSTLTGTADPLGPARWDRFVGFGRLNTFRALRAALRLRSR
jgi:thermitase